MEETMKQRRRRLEFTVLASPGSRLSRLYSSLSMAKLRRHSITSTAAAPYHGRSAGHQPREPAVRPASASRPATHPAFCLPAVSVMRYVTVSTYDDHAEWYRELYCVKPVMQ